MRIAHAHRALVAVLHFAIFFITISCHVHHRDSSHTSEHVRHSSRNLTWSQELPLRDKQLYILQESYKQESKKQDWEEYEGSGVECCPSVPEMTEPKSGTSHEGVLVELYRDNNNTQRFFERSCAPNVEGQPCRFIDKKLYNQSKCEQQWSYSYALLLNPHPHQHQQLSITGTVRNETQWTLGYIKVRSGCRCKLFPKKERKKKRFQHNNGLT